MCANLLFTNTAPKYNKYRIVLWKTNFFLVQHPELFLRVKYILAVLKFHYYFFIFFACTMQSLNIISLDRASNLLIYLFPPSSSKFTYLIDNFAACSIHFGLLGQYYWTRPFFNSLSKFFSVYFNIIEIFISYRRSGVKVVKITP